MSVKIGKTILIFGGTGQAGSYLTEKICTSVEAPAVISVGSRECDLMVEGEAARLIMDVNPDEIYNLAAIMFAPRSWEYPNEYWKVNASAVVEMISTLYRVNPRAKFFQAGSAEMFLKTHLPIDERSTLLVPANPYGAAKYAALDIVRVYQKKGMFACTGVFFNMESPRRKDTFFSRKVTTYVVYAANELADGRVPLKLELGRLDAVRDWGWTPDYMDAVLAMMTAEKPESYIIASGYSSTCKKFVEEAFRQVGIRNWWDHVDYNATNDTDDVMYANPTKIQNKLGWKAKYEMSGVIRELIGHERKRLGQSIVAG